MWKFLALFLGCLLAFSAPTIAQDVYVNGYYKSDGTYVQPHYRSAPDGDPTNNWSTKGNVNPYTGEIGTKDPYGSGSGIYNNGNNGSGGGYGQPLLGGPSTNCGSLSLNC